MTNDNLPALRQPAREIARADTDSWTNVFTEVLELARGIADTEFVPTSLRGSIPATTAAILYGREVGLPPMTALNSTHVIEGRPSIEAQAMRAMILAAGHEIEVLESTGAVCRMRARRNGSERWTPVVEWTIDAARAAGLAGNPKKQNWQKYPRRMLQARCTSELAELYFPDVVMGFRSIEEMDDSAEENEQEAAPSTTVQRSTRKRAAAKKATPPAPPAERPKAPSGPPLPGEDGYDPTPAAGQTSDGGNGEGEAQASPSDTGPDDSGEVNGTEATEGQTRTRDGGESVPADPESSTDDGSDVVDAEIVDDEKPSDPGPRHANRAQVRAVNTILAKSFDVTGDERHRVVSALIGREIQSVNHVTANEVSPLLDALKMLDDANALWALVLASEQRRAADDADQDEQEGAGDE